MSGGCVEGAVVTEALDVLAGDGDAAAGHVRLQRRRGVRRRPHLRRHRSTSSSNRSTGSAACCSRRCATRCASEQPVALATVIEGPNLGAKLLVEPGRGRRSARSATPTSTGSWPATRWASSRPAAPASATTAPQGAGQRDARSRCSSSRSRRRREMLIFGAVDFTAALVPGGEGARLPRHRVRRPRGVRHPAALPDGRRGRRRLAQPPARAGRRPTSARATRCACSPTTPSSTCRRSSPRSPPTSATSV